MKRPPRGFTYATIGAALFVAALLVACDPRGLPFGGVIPGLGQDYRLSDSADRELDRFRRVYRQYAAAGGDADRLKHFTDAFKRVRVDYVQVVDDKKLIDEAVRGVEELKAEPATLPPTQAVEAALDAMLASLDPHSGYLNPEEYREMQLSTKGEFGGLGLVVTMDEGLVKVVSPIEGTPAHRAGFKTGDIITHLDGEGVKGMSLMQAVTRMRGEPGSRIRLTVRRAGQADFDVTLTRAIIEVQAVRWHVEGDIGYVRVASFSEKAEEGLEAALKGIRDKLGKELRGVVLDLRNNPGGLLDQAVAVADAFLEKGIVVTVRGRRDDRTQIHEARSGDLARGLPMAVLINGGSASASEIVAAALQDHQRATLLGTRSFGKGSVQTIAPLPVEGALRLTTALYYMPSGRSIQAAGVVPDIVVNGKESGEQKREADLPHALTAGQAAATPAARATVGEDECPAAGEDGKDRQLGCALLYLRAGARDERFLAELKARPQG
jgi:carboxyl-terminal processing protease